MDPEMLDGESLELHNFLAAEDVSIVAHLAKNVIDFDAGGLTLESFVECDFTGYVEVPIETFAVLEGETVERGEAVSAPIEFEAWPDIQPQTATAVYLTMQKGEDPPQLFAVYPLYPPVAMDLPDRKIRFQIRLTSFAEVPVP